MLYIKLLLRFHFSHNMNNCKDVDVRDVQLHFNKITPPEVYLNDV